MHRRREQIGGGGLVQGGRETSVAQRTSTAPRTSMAPRTSPVPATPAATARCSKSASGLSPIFPFWTYCSARERKRSDIYDRKAAARFQPLPLELIHSILVFLLQLKLSLKEFL